MRAERRAHRPLSHVDPRLRPRARGHRAHPLHAVPIHAHRLSSASARIAHVLCERAAPDHFRPCGAARPGCPPPAQQPLPLEYDARLDVLLFSLCN